MSAARMSTHGTRKHTPARACAHDMRLGQPWRATYKALWSPWCCCRLMGGEEVTLRRKWWREKRKRDKSTYNTESSNLEVVYPQRSKLTQVPPIPKLIRSLRSPAGVWGGTRCHRSGGGWHMGYGARTLNHGSFGERVPNAQSGRSRRYICPFHRKCHTSSVDLQCSCSS